jgi:hypothetical protein
MCRISVETKISKLNNAFEAVIRRHYWLLSNNTVKASIIQGAPQANSNKLPSIAGLIVSVTNNGFLVNDKNTL